MYAVQEAIAETRHGTTHWFKTGEEEDNTVHCHLLFSSYVDDIMGNGGLDESQAGINTAQRNNQ